MPIATDDELARSRRALRRARVQAALGIPRSTVQNHRDRLLLPLLETPGTHEGDFDTLSEKSVDVVVSLATAEIDESGFDALAVMLMCIETLALDGQFARLATLAPRVSGVASRLRVERPYLRSAVDALGSLMRGDRPGARQLIAGALDPAGDLAQVKSSEAVADLLVLAAVRAVAEDLPGADHQASKTEYLERCRQAVINRGEGLALNFIDAVKALDSSTWVARPDRVLQASDETYLQGPLVEYLAQRGVPSLFPAQIGAIRGGATTQADCVVALPTSSGKTFLAELRIAATLSRHPGASAIYVAPYRLLGRQVLESFTHGLERLGLTVQDLGSGYDSSSTPLTTDAGLPDVAIATPERLDSLVRVANSDTVQGRQAAALLDRCRLLVFDELQLVGRAGRGPRFELLLTRLRDRYPSWEFFGLSAASHGADELSQWLVERDPLSGGRRPTGTLELLWETSGRLLQRVGSRVASVGELPRSNKAMDDAAYLILKFERSHQPVLAVETSRVAAESLAKKVSALAPEAGDEWRAQLADAELLRIDEVAEEVKAVLGDAHPLADQIANGIAFHHAGVPTHILRLIEGLARQRLLRLLSATTTVAEGADLPFRVVVIPHLNFPGPSGRLERDLYLNIIGRAGRANVTVEGMVFVLDSDARTLKNVVRSSLWSDTLKDRVHSQLAEPIANLDKFDRLDYYFDVEGQIMGWLGDGRSYVDDQDRTFASKTFGWFQGGDAERARVADLVQTVLQDLEEHEYIVAGSPFQLTEVGARARLSGLSSVSVEHLSLVLDQAQVSRLMTIGQDFLLTDNDSDWLSWLLFQAVETLEHSLWLRRSNKTDDSRFRSFLAVVDDNSRWPAREPLDADIKLLSQWVQGASLEDLALLPPRADHARALFGGKDLSKLTSDAAEYVGKLSYPAGWVWSGLRVLAGPAGETVPAFVKDALEFGVPSESAAQLVRNLGLTRIGALRLSTISPSWADVQAWLRDAEISDIRSHELTTLDERRVRAFRRRSAGA